nr:hypothetical protein [Tanacetum cinerariifolium]
MTAATGGVVAAAVVAVDDEDGGDGGDAMRLMRLTVWLDEMAAVGWIMPNLHVCLRFDLKEKPSNKISMFICCKEMVMWDNDDLVTHEVMGGLKK